MIGSLSTSRFILRRTFSSVAAASRSLGWRACAAITAGLIDFISSGRCPGSSIPSLTTRVDRAAIGVAEDHDERRAEELDGIFEAREAVIVEEIAGKTHDENVARTRSNRSSGETRLSAQLRTAAIGYCDFARSARSCEKSLSFG